MFQSVVHSFLNHRWQLYTKFEIELHELRYLFWETTRQCNLSCLHCGSDCTADASIKGLDKEVILKTFREIADHQDASKIMLVVTGGEPLVRRDLFLILSKARDLGFRLGMVTNGWALNKKVAQIISATGISSIVVSLDGPEIIHDWLRNRSGSFSRAVSALGFLKEEGIPVVEAITCVTPRLIPFLEETYQIVTNSGATHWRVFNIFPIGRAKNNEDVLLTPDHFRMLIPEMIKLRERGKKEDFHVNLSEEGWLGWDYENKLRDTPYFCRAGVNISGIMADGTISACPNLPQWFAQGNIKTDSFVNVWENRYDIFRDRVWMKKGICENCPEFPVCQGNSLHIWDPETNQPSWCHYRILHEKDD
ncbi:radical SAM protein [Myxococcota bacterium]|nr:radical SAM protein [Myxococcota bacterium]MBU1382804.1 radical SAM protein [Myxococcota bacterium]MBU1497373.1 radical SAM protein [Myxococcota bacterium]